MQGDIHFEGATVTSVALGKTSGGKEQIAITFSTGNPEYPTLTRYAFFTDAALPYTEADLRTLGWDPVEYAWQIEQMIEMQILVGAKADLVCAMETYEGKERIKVKFINSPGGGGMKERMSPEEASSFGASLRQRLGVTGGAAKRPAPRPVAVAAGPVDDGDVPF